MKQKITQAKALLSHSKPKTAEAIRILEPLARKKSAPWPVYHFMGVALAYKKMYKEALNFLKHAVDAGADEPETWNTISICYFNLAKYSEAELTAERALKMNPDFFEAWLHLGSVYKAQARLNEALQCYQKANQIDPKSAGVAFRIADIYSNQGDHDQALKLFDIAIQMDPDYEEAYNEKARILQKKGQPVLAKECLDQIISKRPDSIPTRVSEAELHKSSGDYDSALRIYELILQKHPKLAGIRVNYALCLLELGNYEIAEKHYLQAIKDDPKAAEPVSNYFMGLHYNPERTKQEIFEAHKIWDANFSPEKRPERPVSANKDKDKQLRLGFISGGFRAHPVGWMITEALEHLPKNEFEIYCYTTNNIFDSVTKRIHDRCDKWQSVLGYDDDVIAGLIKNDEIDILVELSGHAADNRLKMVVQEPAPVIVKWVGGLFNTTGLKAVDYLITDHIETPAGEEEFFTEKLVRMPDDYITFMPPDYAPEVELLPAVDNGFITFGCFNNPTKVNREVLLRWAEIMKQVPNSRLFLKSRQYDTEALRERITGLMEEAGIGSNRIVFEGQSSHDELLNCYNRVDVALDTWPYSGGLTTCEALWMGVPVITYPGPTFAGRHSATHLVNAGFPEWVADSWDDYVKKAAELAKSTDQLGKLRGELRERVASSVLCDGRRFASHLANAFREMWRQRVKAYEHGLDEDEWQRHIDVKPLNKLPLQKEAYSNGNSDDHLLDKLNALQRELTMGDMLSQAEQHEQADYSVNGNHTLNGVAKHEASEEEFAEGDDREVLRIQTRDGITICTPNNLNILTPYVLLEKSEWFEDEIGFIDSYLEPGMNVLDAGAGFGVYGLKAAQLVGENGRVFCFEPGRLARQHLEMSRGANTQSNIDVIPKALYDVGGDRAWRGDPMPELSKLAEQGQEKVQTITLNDWWQLEGKPAIDVFKLDVNGDEAKVLAGASDLLSELSPVILVSISSNTGSAEKPAEILTQAGFKFYEFIPGVSLLSEYNPETADPYLQNVIAIKKGRIAELTGKGWFHDESIHPEEPVAGLWKQELAKMPWATVFMDEWLENVDDKHAEHYWAIDCICKAEKLKVEFGNDGDVRNRRAALLLGAARILIGHYNSGRNSTSLAFTLSRLLRMLGKRSQAVEVMQKLLETTQLGKQNMDTGLPFLMPVSEQDESGIVTDQKNWLSVRTIEAWILLKELTAFFCGIQEQKFIEVLKDNPESGAAVLKWQMIDDLMSANGTGKRDKNVKLKEFEVYPQNGHSLNGLHNTEVSAGAEAVEQEARIIPSEFWTAPISPGKAAVCVNISHKMKNCELDEYLDGIIESAQERLNEDGADGFAFFLMVRGLLSVKTLNNETEPSVLKWKLAEKGWSHKATLYNYFFERVDVINRVENPKLSVVVVSNKINEDVVKNLKEIYRQKTPEVEILFVNNGLAKEKTDAIYQYTDSMIHLRQNAGACMARNFGALFSESNIFMFVDDDGMPEDGMINAHIDLHKNRDIYVARGIYRPKKEGGYMPAHYDLGQTMKPAVCLLEGNTSFQATPFFKTGGWNDSIMVYHEGMELSYRYHQQGFEQKKLIYFPDAVLRHDYVKPPKGQNVKNRLLKTSHLLIQQMYPDLNDVIQNWETKF